MRCQRSSVIRARSTAGKSMRLYPGSAVPTRTRRMTSLNVGLSGSGSCCEHERRWSSSSLISLAPKSGVLMSGFSQLAHVTTNSPHSRMVGAPGRRQRCRLRTDQAQIRRRADTERFRGGADGELLAGNAPKLPLVLAVRWRRLLRESSGAEVREGKERVLGLLVGQVMKGTGGKGPAGGGGAVAGRRSRDRSACAAQRLRPSNDTTLRAERSRPSRQRALMAALATPFLSDPTPNGAHPQCGQK